MKFKRAPIVIAENHKVLKKGCKIHFKIGHYYRHPGSGDMAILAWVKTTLWGLGLLAECANNNSHCVMVVGEDEDSAQGWAEITEQEWLVNFS